MVVATGGPPLGMDFEFYSGPNACQIYPVKMTIARPHTKQTYSLLSRTIDTLMVTDRHAKYENDLALNSMPETLDFLSVSPIPFQAINPTNIP